MRHRRPRVPVRDLLISMLLVGMLGVWTVRDGWSYDAEAIGDVVDYVEEETLAGYLLSLVDFGTRFTLSHGFCEAGQWLHDSFASFGLDVVMDPFAMILPGFRNVVATLPGSAETDALLIVCAHYDSISSRPFRNAPGADDNASGVATLLGLAGALTAEPPRARPVVFAITSAEEHGAIGARALVESMGEAAPFACLNLDSVGRLSSGRLYVLNASSAREWRFIMMGVGYTTGVDVAIVPEPLDASDDMACLDAGIPAIQLFTGPHTDYHKPSDTADKIDDDGLAEVAEAAWQVVDYLAQRPDPLSVSLELGLRGKPEPSRHPGGGHPGGGHPGGQAGARKVSLGTMPDFAFAGPGVRVQEVREGSPAAEAGIQAGDVLLAVGDTQLQGLRDLSAALKGHSAGDTVTVRVQRGDDALDLSATLEEN